MLALADLDPNILGAALIAAIPTTIAAGTGLWLALRSNRRVEEKVDRNHEEVKTNHGLRAGEYIEMIGPLVEWAEEHTAADNEMREVLGLRPARPPRVSANTASAPQPRS